MYIKKMAKDIYSIIKTFDTFHIDCEFSRALFEKRIEEVRRNMYDTIPYDEWWCPCSLNSLIRNDIVRLTTIEEFEMGGNCKLANGDIIEKPFTAKRYYYEFDEEKIIALKRAYEILKNF